MKDEAHKMPSEAVQISAQIFVREMALRLSSKNAVPLKHAVKLAAKETRICMEELALISPTPEAK